MTLTHPEFAIHAKASLSLPYTNCGVFAGNSATANFIELAALDTAPGGLNRE